MSACEPKICFYPLFSMIFLSVHLLLNFLWANFMDYFLHISLLENGTDRFDFCITGIFVPVVCKFV